MNLSGVDRFFNIAVRSRFKNAFTIADHGIRGDGNNGCAGKVIIFSQFTRRGVSIHFRKLDIKEE